MSLTIRHSEWTIRPHHFQSPAPYPCHHVARKIEPGRVSSNPVRVLSRSKKRHGRNSTREFFSKDAPEKKRASGHRVDSKSCRVSGDDVSDAELSAEVGTRRETASTATTGLEFLLQPTSHIANQKSRPETCSFRCATD